jgi:hypothetical protein
MDNKRYNARTLNFGNKELPLPGVARRRTVELYPDATGNHTPYGLIFSRWLIVTSICSSEAPVRCFDLDADKGNDPAEEVPLQLYAKHSTVLYTTSGMIFDLRCVQSTRTNGERVAFVILVENFFALSVTVFFILVESNIGFNIGRCFSSVSAQKALSYTLHFKKFLQGMTCIYLVFERYRLARG